MAVTVRKPRFASVIFDADSTLASIEGIDWLGALRGDDVGNVVQQLTTRAMVGELPLENVYELRLDTIRPTRNEISALGQAYVDAITAGAVQLLAELKNANVQIAIVSGGLRDALLPLARELGLAAADVFAVELGFDDHGRYVSLPPSQLLAAQLGKVAVVRGLSLPRPSVMVGDGSTDAAVRVATDAFIAYTG
ncbi:MAG: HAD-IB family phosphatase, partial [Gemmatimonadota bacterium]|nr:HAD-IB family phosphatase [Gemmatimonadota bacterium]